MQHDNLYLYLQNAILPRIDDNTLILESEWLQIFQDIQTHFCNWAPELTCSVKIGWNFFWKQVRVEIQVSKWKPEAHRHDFFECFEAASELNQGLVDGVQNIIQRREFTQFINFVMTKL